MRTIILPFIILGLFSCKNDQPNKITYEGFKWEKISGAGITLNTQRNEDIKLMIDNSLPGVVMVKDSLKKPVKLIQIFNLPNNSINDVLIELQKDKKWDKSQKCKFIKIKSENKNITRYALIPDGDYKRRIQDSINNFPIAYTCNGWGEGNSGKRFFEIHKEMPNKALFIEIGQDTPLFDINSIKFNKEEVASKKSKNTLYLINGTLQIGHEVRSFKPDSSEDEYWIIDKTGTLDEIYDNTTKGIKNCKPVNATLKLEYNGKWNEGFAAEYSGVYFVREILEIKPYK